MTMWWRLEQDFQQGRINASQYRAIYRHYMEQREVALRLREKYPDSDRWRVVLEEGKIIQEGTHEELNNTDGYYKELYINQLSGKES